MPQDAPPRVLATIKEIKRISKMPEKRGGKRAGAGRKPGSLSRATKEHKITLSDLARKHTEVALSTLVSILRKPEATDSARVAAATAILDRAYGKPPQSLELSGSVAVNHEAALAELE